MDAKLQQAQEMLKEAEERHQREKDFVSLRAVLRALRFLPCPSAEAHSAGSLRTERRRGEAAAPQPAPVCRDTLRAVPGDSRVTAFALPQLLKEAVASQRMCELMKQQETHLKQQVKYSLCAQPDYLLVFWFLVFFLPKQGTTQSSLTWKTQGQDCS